MPFFCLAHFIFYLIDFIEKSVFDVGCVLVACTFLVTCYPYLSRCLVLLF